MNTQQPQIARPTPAAPQQGSQNTTQGSNPQQSNKPSLIAAKPQPQIISKPAATQVVSRNPVPASAATAPKKAAQAAPKTNKKAKKKKAKASASAAASAAKKQWWAEKKAAQQSASKPAYSNNNTKQASQQASAAIATVQSITQRTTENMNEAIAASKQNIEAAIECGNNAASISKSISTELNKLASQIIAQNTQAIQKFLACRTASDLLNLGNSLLRTQADQAYNSGLKLAELTTQFSRVAEPIGERLLNVSQSLTKKLRQ